jgi:hypothetical protein
MATTTTNFGWDIPQSTDLVKDGATAIAALGQDIDTAFVDLKGGTTGQVLAKASGTDLDFSWVAQDDSNAIQNAIVDAKGDLIAATAADTPARLAVGTNGQVLTADSTASTGLAWATPSSSGGWTSIASGSLSGASLDLSSISGSYKNLRLVCRNMNVTGPTSAAEMLIRLNNLSTSIYNGLNHYNNNGTAGAIANAAEPNFYSTYVNMDGSTSASFLFDVFDYANTTSNKMVSMQMQYTGSGNMQSTRVFGSCRTTQAIDRITVFPSNSRTFNAGTYILYGGN